VNILGCKPTRLANDHSIALIVPFQNRTRADTKPLADLGRNGNLTLCGELRVSQGHGTDITMVM